LRASRNTSNQELNPFGHPAGHLKGRENDRCTFEKARPVQDCRRRQSSNGPSGLIHGLHRRVKTDFPSEQSDASVRTVDTGAEKSAPEAGHESVVLSPHVASLGRQIATGGFSSSRDESRQPERACGTSG
jgi:hypothetical protein